MQDLIREFKALHEDKIKRLDSDMTSATPEERLQMKVYALQSYVRDLADQNQVLVEAIEDLDKDTHHKGSGVRMKLCTSGSIVHVPEVESRTVVSRGQMAEGRPAECADAGQLEDVEAQRSASHPGTLGWRSELKRDTPEEREIVCLEDSFRKAEGEGSEAGQTRRSLLLAETSRDPGRHAQTGQDTTLQRVRHLEQDAGPQWRHSQECVERALPTQEKRCQQLSQDNSQLPDSLAAPQNKLQLQTTEDTVGDVIGTPGQVSGRQQVRDQPVRDQPVRDQLQSANQEVGRLRQELTHLRRTSERKVQRRDLKLGALAKKMEDMKWQRADCQRELLGKQSALERLQRETDKLGAKMEEHGQEYAALAPQTKERLENDLAHSHGEYRTAHLEVRSRDHLILQLRAEMKSAQQTHRGTLEELSALQREVGRLNEEVRGRQEETCLLRGEVREREEIAEQKERERRELHLQLCASQQQVQSQAESISRLTSDLEAVKAAHNADAEHRSHLRNVQELHSARLGQSQARLREREAQIADLTERVSRAEAGQREAAEKAREGLMRTRDDELESARRQLETAREDLKEAAAGAQSREESVAIFKQKYAVAMEKARRVQGQVDCLEEELRYSQQQLRDSHVATSAVEAELAELGRRYREKFSQWESSREALDQLTDELQANQRLLRESQDKVGQCEAVVAALKEQVDDLKQQTSVCERALIRHRQTHSHPDREHLRLLTDNRQLQKRCAEQVQHLAESERAILQIRTKLETQAREKADLERSLVASHHDHLTASRQREQEVTRLEQEVERLKLELTDSQIKEQEFGRWSAEELRTARREAERLGQEAEAGRAEVQRLQEEALRKEEGAARESQDLRAGALQLSRELEELRGQHQRTVEELSVRAEEEARRIGRRLSEGKREEEKRRSDVEKLKRELVSVSDALQQAVRLRLKEQRERQDVQGQVDTLRLELEEARSDNTQLRHESQLLVANGNRWMSEQRSSNESLAAQMKAQHKVLVIVTEEKEHLQEANDTLRQEMTELRDAAAQRDAEMMERLKAQLHEWDSRQEDKTRERETCVALNLSRIEDMRSRLQSNLKAIGMLNQQLSALGGENAGLRRQLQEERAARQRAELLLPPPPHPPFFPTKEPISSTFSLPSTPLPPSSSSLPFPLRCRRRPANRDVDLKPDRTGTPDLERNRDLAVLTGRPPGASWSHRGVAEEEEMAEYWRRRRLARGGGGGGGRAPDTSLEHCQSSGRVRSEA